MKIKDKVDIISKKIDVAYKKALILLAGAGGSGAYAIKFALSKGIFSTGIFSIFFIFCAIGVGMLYIKIDRLEKEMYNE
jgi:hypothetical protein